MSQDMVVGELLTAGEKITKAREAMNALSSRLQDLAFDESIRFDQEVAIFRQLVLNWLDLHEQDPDDEPKILRILAAVEGAK